MNIAYFICPKSKTVYLYDTNTLRQGIEKMRYHGYSAVPVLTKDGRYFGTVTDGDLLRSLYDSDDKSTDKREEKILISDIIRPDRTRPVRINAAMQELLLKVMEQNFVAVVDDRDYFMGIITRRDIMKYYYNSLFPDSSGMYE